MAYVGSWSLMLLDNNGRPIPEEQRPQLYHRVSLQISQQLNCLPHPQPFQTQSRWLSTSCPQFMYTNIHKDNFSKCISDINFMVKKINLRLIKEIQILLCTKGGQINVINPVAQINFKSVNPKAKGISPQWQYHAGNWQMRGQNLKWENTEI